MKCLREVKQQIEHDPTHWAVYLMDFVDDFRYYRAPQSLTDAFVLDNEQLDALLASTAEYLCDELALPPPDWLEAVPPCSAPYFVSGVENLKSFTLAQSPARFRVRKVFVLENFLSRV